MVKCIYMTDKERDNEEISGLGGFRVPKKMGRPVIRENADRLTFRVDSSLLFDIRLLMAKDRRRLGIKSRNGYLEYILARYVDERREEVEEIREMISRELSGGGSAGV